MHIHRGTIASTGLASVADNGLSAIRVRASLMVSVVLAAGMCSKRVDLAVV